MSHTSRRVTAWLLSTAVVLALGATVVSLTPTEALAQKAVAIPHLKTKELPPPVPGVVGAPAVTLYLDRGPEKAKAAELMTELHAAMAARGYTFVDLEPHEENADLEGWWITYVAR